MIMNPTLKSYILSFMPSDVSVPKALNDKGEMGGQASKNGLVIALLQAGVLPEELIQLLGIPDGVELHQFLQDTWLPTRDVTISQILEEVEKLLG
jgi:hypothetical protein